MESQINIYSRLKHILKLGRSKSIMLSVSFLLIVLIGYSIFHFVNLNNYLEKNLSGANNSILKANHPYNEWIGTNTSTAMFLRVSILLLLLLEIRYRKKINAELRAQKEYFHTTINSIAEGLITTGKKGEILFMNHAAEKLTGWSYQEAKNQPLEKIYDVVNEESGESFKNVVRRILKNGQTAEFENYTLLQTKERVQLIISNCGSPILDAKKNISGAVLVFNDITEKSKLEKELKQKQEFLQKTLDLSLDIICTANTDGVFISMNAASKKILGYASEELIRQPMLNFIHEDDRKKTIQTFWEIITGKEESGFVNRYMHKNGTLIPIQWSSFWDEDSKLIYAVGRDITELKKYENKLKESAAFSNGTLDSLSSHIAVVNSAGKIIKVNKTWKRFAQNNDANMEKCDEGANYFDVLYKCQNNKADDTPKKALDGIQKVLNGSLDEFYLEYPCHSPKEERWFYMRVNKFESTETLLLIEHHNISERKKAEEETQKAIERYDILAQATSDTIWDWDIANNKMTYNYSITNMFGYEISEVENIADWWKKNIHPDDLQRVFVTLNDTYKNKIQNLCFEYRFRCADNSYKHIYDRALVQYDKYGKATRIIGAMQDISYQKEEEKRITKAMSEAQEKERNHIGRELHDNVNQILASSLLTLGMAKEKSTDKEKATEYISTTATYISYAIEEIRKLSHELTPTTFEDNSLKDFFENLLTSININDRFKISLCLDEINGVAISEEIQINLYRILQEQLKNILKYSEASTIEITVTVNGDVIRMRTYDDGKGFDTKKSNKGIGLNNIKKRVESFSGNTIFNSAPGKGCEIIVEIPLNYILSSV